MLDPSEGTIAYDFLKAAACDAATACAAAFDQIVVGAAARFASPTPLDFRPLESLKRLQTDGPFLIGILTPGTWDHWEASTISEVQQPLRSHGCRFSFGYHRESPYLFVREFERLASQKPAAILMVPPPAGLISSAFERSVRARHIAIVTLDRGLGQFPCVEPDHQLGSAKITEALLKDRPKAAVLVTGDRRISSVAQRVVGFREAIERHGRPGIKTRSIALGLSPLTGGQLLGDRELREVVRNLSNTEGVGFVVDCPQVALQVFGTVEHLKDGWPSRWQLLHFDSLHEGDLLTYRSMGRGPGRVVGCKVDRAETGNVAADLVWKAIEGQTDLTGKRVKIPTTIEDP